MPPTEQELLKRLDDAALAARIAELRAEKERIQGSLRAAVAEADDRATIAKITKDYPRLAAQIVKPAGIQSAEQVGKQ